MSIAQQVIEKLQKYDGDMLRNSAVITDWDIILEYDLDWESTERADISNMNDIAIFTDGSRLIWDEPEQEWKIG